MCESLDRSDANPHRFDPEDDAGLTRGQRKISSEVLVGECIDVRKGPFFRHFQDAAPDDDPSVGIGLIMEGDGDPGVPSDVVVLDPSHCGIHGQQVVFGPNPHGRHVGRSVGKESR